MESINKRLVIQMTENKILHLIIIITWTAPMANACRITIFEVCWRQCLQYWSEILLKCRFCYVVCVCYKLNAGPFIQSQVMAMHKIVRYYFFKSDPCKDASWSHQKYIISLGSRQGMCCDEFWFQSIKLINDTWGNYSLWWTVFCHRIYVVLSQDFENIRIF